MKLILEQDDAAPDSMHYFKRRFREITGYDFNNFRNIVAQPRHTEYSFSHVTGRYKLEYRADHPFWCLYESEPSK